VRRGLGGGKAQLNSFEIEGSRLLRERAICAPEMSISSCGLMVAVAPEPPRQILMAELKRGPGGSHWACSLR